MRQMQKWRQDKYIYSQNSAHTKQACVDKSCTHMWLHSVGLKVGTNKFERYEHPININLGMIVSAIIDTGNYASFTWKKKTSINLWEHRLIPVADINLQPTVYTAVDEIV